MVDLKRLASVSKLNLTEKEKEAAIECFGFWADKFDMLEMIDTENTEPLITVSSLVNVMREDISYKMISTDTLLENAPEQYDGYIVVPRVIE